MQLSGPQISNEELQRAGASDAQLAVQGTAALPGGNVGPKEMSA